MISSSVCARPPSRLLKHFVGNLQDKKPVGHRKVPIKEHNELVFRHLLAASFNIKRTFFYYVNDIHSEAIITSTDSLPMNNFLAEQPSPIAEEKLELLRELGVTIVTSLHIQQ